jgi:hypothetical protein
MTWTAHYLDRRLNSDAISRSVTSKEGALRQACYLIRQNCVVHFIKGPNDEKLDAVTIIRWCKSHPIRPELHSLQSRPLGGCPLRRTAGVLPVPFTLLRG